MKTFEESRTQIRNRADIARLFGLPTTARERDIRRAFDLETRCEATMEISAEEILSFPRPETWEIVVQRATPCPTVQLRSGGRGDWVSSAGDLPRAVLEFFDLREDRSGRLVSSRSWKSWSKMRWLPPGSRRLKSRDGTICAVVEVPEVARPTGRRAWSLRISSMLDLAGPREEILQLPVTPSDIGSAVVALRDRAEEALRAGLVPQ